MEKQITVEELCNHEWRVLNQKIAFVKELQEKKIATRLKTKISCVGFSDMMDDASEQFLVYIMLTEGILPTAASIFKNNDFDINFDTIDKLYADAEEMIYTKKLDEIEQRISDDLHNYVEFEGYKSIMKSINDRLVLRTGFHCLVHILKDLVKNMAEISDGQYQSYCQYAGFHWTMKVVGDNYHVTRERIK